MTIRCTTCSSHLAAASLALLLIGGCHKTAPPAPERSVLVGPENLARVERRQLSSGPVLSGTLEAKERADLIAEVSGSVLEVAAELGDQVSRNEMIARIETNGLGADYTSAKEVQRAAQEALDLARSNLARTEQLVAKGAEPRNRLDIDRNAVKAAEAQLAGARARQATAFKQLEATVVRSPIDGVISERAVHQGDVVAPGTKLVTIIDPSSMRLEASVSADDLPVVKQGARVEFSVRGFPGRTFVGAIERIAPAADAATRRVQLLVSVPNPDKTLIAGLFAEGRVTAEHRDALSLPDDAVDHAGQRDTALVIRDGKAARVDVRLGLHDEKRGLIEIRSGLQEGERVITGTAQDIKTGTPIQEIAAPARAAESRRDEPRGRSQEALAADSESHD
jgi:RND family efflux transporter MFP subunit